MSEEEKSKIEKLEERIEKLEKEKKQAQEKDSRKETEEGGKVSRRNFLKMSALSIGTLGMTSLGASKWINLTQKATESNGVPTGSIIMWSGSTTDIPSGWTLCDGNDENGQTVPDLRNRFIVGAGDQYNTGNTGGEKQVQLTVDEMPSHDHGIKVNGSSGAIENIVDDNSGYSEYNSNYSNMSGGDQAHENRPPYYALAYIMKL